MCVVRDTSDEGMFYYLFIERLFVEYILLLKGAMQRDFDDLILASPIIQNFSDKLYFFFLEANNARILHKNDCERKLF